jgi:hypothetical protein
MDGVHMAMWAETARKKTGETTRNAERANMKGTLACGGIGRWAKDEDWGKTKIGKKKS